MKVFRKLQYNLDSVLEYGIYLLVFLLPLQTRLFLKQAYLGGAFWEYGTISLYLVDIFLIGLLVISTIVIVRKKEPIKIKKIWYLLAFFEFLVFVSIFFADSKSLALYGYIKILLGLFLFFIISESNYSHRKMTLSFLSGVFLQSIIGILQFFKNYSLPSKYLGMATHDPNVLGTFVVELEDKTRILRAYGGLDHPNMYAIFIFLGIFMFVKYLLELKHRNSISFRRQSVYFLILSFLYFSFLFSFSRAAFLIFIIYILFLIYWSIRDRNRRELIFKIILTFFTISIISFSLYGNLYLQRFNSSSRLENISNTERLNQTNEAINIIKENLFSGIGINNYTSQLKLFDIEEREAWNYQPVHNVYLLSLAELGLLGFITFLTIFAFLLYKCFKNKLFFDFFLIISILMLFLFDHWLWSLHFGIMFLFFILALIQRKISA
ncbi:MAG: O-antigen ligase family protein [Patescibacteria group bacterium]|jgi:putative inorganic carbon (HCO3(-)) transporter|nr:O-antigen ligase family protein [Patescibacteria group bacterium]